MGEKCGFYLGREGGEVNLYRKRRKRPANIMGGRKEAIPVFTPRPLGEGGR